MLPVVVSQNCSLYQLPQLLLQLSKIFEKYQILSHSEVQASPITNDQQRPTTNEHSAIRYPIGLQMIQIEALFQSICIKYNKITLFGLMDQRQLHGLHGVLYKHSESPPALNENTCLGQSSQLQEIQYQHRPHIIQSKNDKFIYEKLIFYPHSKSGFSRGHQPIVRKGLCFIQGENLTILIKQKYFVGVLFLSLCSSSIYINQCRRIRKAKIFSLSDKPMVLNFISHFKLHPPLRFFNHQLQMCKLSFDLGKKECSFLNLYY